MKSKLVIFILLSIFSSGLIACFLPSFINTNGKELSNEQISNYNDSCELEPYSTSDKNLSTIQVEKLNWFSVVNNLFEKFSDAIVIDVQTKKQYNVRRVGGYNHADVEALTANDTEIFKGLYNGTWSWVRRPVWVKINNIWIAGSINGMPHSYSYITDNNEDGHTCIHFYMSRTHGTDNLDPSHQEAVETAYNRQTELSEFLSNKK